MSKKSFVKGLVTKQPVDIALIKELQGHSLQLADDVMEVLQENLYDLIDIKAAMNRAPGHAIRDIIANIFLQALDMQFRTADRRFDDKIDSNLKEPERPAPDMN